MRIIQRDLARPPGLSQGRRVGWGRGAQVIRSRRDENGLPLCPAQGWNVAEEGTLAPRRADLASPLIETSEAGARLAVAVCGVSVAEFQQRRDAIVGCLLGRAVGDAIGLPFEGLSREQVARRIGAEPLGHSLFGRRGMVSDDTEHACMTGQALLAAPDSPEAFARSLAWRLRGWLLGLPASVGWGTLRAVVRLWLGWSTERSGVHSAGNGPAMRAALLRVCRADEPARLDAFVALFGADPWRLGIHQPHGPGRALLLGVRTP